MDPLKLTPTGWSINVLCNGEAYPECQCSDGAPRRIPTYVHKEGGPPFEFFMLCDACRERLIGTDEIDIASAGVLPIEASDFPGSALE